MSNLLPRLVVAYYNGVIYNLLFAKISKTWDSPLPCLRFLTPTRKKEPFRQNNCCDNTFCKFCCMLECT